MAHTVKNLPAIQETWVQFLGWEDPLDKGKATRYSLENSMDCIIHGVTKSWTQLNNFHFHTYISHVSFWIRVFIFSEYMPRSGVSRSHSSSVFGFLRIWLHTFDSQYQVCLLPLVPTHLLVLEWAFSPSLSWLGPPYPHCPHNRIPYIYTSIDNFARLTRPTPE